MVVEHGLTIGVCVFLQPTQINQHAKWVRRKCDEIRSEQLAVGTSARQNADREHEKNGIQTEKAGGQDCKKKGMKKAGKQSGKKNEAAVSIAGMEYNATCLMWFQTD